MTTKLFGALYHRWFSKPKVDRPLYQAILRNEVRSIVELGIDSIDRSLKMVDLAQQGREPSEIRYAAVDMFDARPSDLPPQKLKDAHRQFASTGAAVRLVPGDLVGGLSRAANELVGIELLIVSARFSDAELEAAWRFVPRMLAPTAVVVRTSPDDESAHAFLSPSELDDLANRGQRLRRAA